MTAFTDVSLTAAGSGRPAMGSFVRKQRCAGQIDQVRVDAIASDALAALHDVIRKYEVTYAEYEALKAWLIRVGEYGEWPLLLDLFIEHVGEEVANADRRAAVGTVEGPFYVPGAPESAGDGIGDQVELHALFGNVVEQQVGQAKLSRARWR